MLFKGALNPRNILIILHGSIGDVTRALPLANLLRRGYPNATIVWSIEPAAFAVIEGHPAVDEVILFDRDRWWKSLGPFLRQIRSRRFDLVLDLQRILKSGLISWWTGAPYRIGFHRHDSKEFNWLFNNHYIPATGEAIPKLMHYLRFAELLGLQNAPIEWRIRLPQQGQKKVEEILQGFGPSFAALFVGSKWESKLWFPEQTAESAAEIQSRYGLGVVLLGGKDDVSFADEVVARRPGLRLANYVGKTTLQEAIGILARATVAIGPDTGLMHLAAAVGTPVVSLWGATNPIRTGPYGYEHLVIRGQADCSPCYLRRCPIGRICMRSIDAEEVLVKVKEVLSAKEVRGAQI